MSPRGRTRTRYGPEEAPPSVEVRPLSPFGSAEPQAPPTEHGDGTPSIEEARPDAHEVAAAETTLAAPPRHRARGFFTVLALSLLAFATGLVVFNSLVMPRLIHGVGEVGVPDIRNLTLDQAEQVLRPLSLQISRAGERFDPSVPRGFVLGQDPSPGSTVRGHKRISVIVSLGEEFSSVPELSSESQRSAEQLLKSSGLRLGAIAHAPSENVGEGLVVTSDPGAESVLPQGSPVSILVSDGAGESAFVMPDLAGREIGSVRRQLESLGFRVGVPPGTPPIGAIVAQRPAAGSRIRFADPIDLQASGRMIR
jgi:serine/threonine-protein kinase